ncbi:MAG: LLM class flavin-dependent oxidoreductase [Cytophagaceae bacterium]
MNLKLSVLDQTPIRNGSNAVEALRESAQLVHLADQLGYTRYWLSEHHNTRSLAGAAPEVLISRLAALTTRIRLGSGGIMLPNHSTLKVAENFRLLEALYPGRIDLGLGRAPGGDRLTSSLLNPSNTFNPQDYVRQLSDLKAFLSGEPDSESGGKVLAIPDITTQPEYWILSSSGESAYLAAHFGMALSYAQFINPLMGIESAKIYREKFVPSEQLEQPKINVGIFVFCAPTEKKAYEMQQMMDYRLFLFEKGRYDARFSYEEASTYPYSEAEWNRVLFNRSRAVSGTPDLVKEKLTQLAQEVTADEIVVSTFTEHAEDRLNSYKLLAEVFELGKS